MRKLSVRIALALVAAGSLAVTLGAHPLGPLTNQQLAQARAGTAAYHDLSVALAAGYVPLGFNPDEGVFEFVNFSLVDCTFDPAHPEGLAYLPSGKGFRLVGVEYAVPMICSDPGVPPEGFDGDADVWEPEGDLPIWRVGAMIWSGRQEGPFDSGGEGSHN
jgi:hypothetical protein